MNTAELFSASRPKSKFAHWQKIGGQGQLFITNGSRLFNVGLEILERFDAAALQGDEAVAQLLTSLGLGMPDFIDDVPVQSPALHAISLAVAQKCNLGCSYCYAGQGSFGAPAKNMSLETAKRSIDLLISGAPPASRINIAFLGGEPLANRSVLQQATEYAAEKSREHNLTASFSITTNGTLLNKEDAAFFEHHGFAVTISLDGIGEVHDRQRPFKNGNSSFELIMSNVQPLLAIQKNMQVSVRCTVTPGNLQLKESLDYFLGLGFFSVGFSPLLRSSNNRDEIQPGHIPQLLNAMIECGLEFERRVVTGKRYAFANMANALKELHAGTHKPYPCGAGAGYMGVSAEGKLSACHRFVGDAQSLLGDIEQGIDRTAQNHWLADRHVHNQSPCGKCWARYLCAGGCHHEVIAKGRPVCDFIRGWLLYCLQAYARISDKCPGYFN